MEHPHIKGILEITASTINTDWFDHNRNNNDMVVDGVSYPRWFKKVSSKRYYIVKKIIL